MSRAFSRTREFGGIVAIFTISLIVCPWTALADTKVTVETGKKLWTISRYLVGMHMVYTFNPGKAYTDGKIAAWARQAGISTARFPGGSTVKRWDWEHPTGVMTGDPWDPAWDKSMNADPQSWMSLDEYLAFVKRSGITPLFGVNSLSGYRFKRSDESVARAVRMVRYVKERGCGGAFWYIGNEEANEYEGGIEGYAVVFKKHATAMKQADPQIKIFWNLNDATPEKIKLFLKHDGGTSDGLETHGKWPYGGNPGRYEPGTVDGWLEEIPLRDKKNNNRAWRLAADEYRGAAAAMGRKNYLVANNEYGIGKSKNIRGFNRYTYGLLMTDMLQEHLLGNWFMTCFWDNIRGDEDGLMSSANGGRLNPLHFGMELLGAAQGGDMLETKTDNKQVYGFAAKTKEEILLFLINKTRSPSTLHVGFSSGHVAGANGKVMQDTKDHWGEVVDFPISKGTTLTATMPPLSFCRIRVAMKRP